MNRHILALAALIVLCAALSAGCGAESVNISDEDVKRVANYSSDIISQHNDNSESRLVDVSTVKRKYQEELDLEIKKKNFQAIEKASKAAEESGSGEGESGESGVYVEPDIPLGQAIGVDFDVYYTSYEVTPSYPTSNSVSDDVYMGMTAAQGDTLMVVHFNISNTSGNDRECDILSLKPTFRLKINGENHTIQQTILSDDLSKFQGTVPAYSSADAVLICEVSQGSIDNIESLSVIVRSAEGRPEYKLI